MPLIVPPPNDEPDFKSTYELGSARGAITAEVMAEYLNVPNWKCSECQTVMFGRCKECVYCKVRFNKHVPKSE